ncbi:hypothetical protein PAAL66ix_06673 [Paenibacillus alvei A6-6i-x]|nr:hypothetical protein PAAL66ix_06673 [Paenibacillus alvei A6-6i-x]
MPALTIEASQLGEGLEIIKESMHATIHAMDWIGK